MTTFKVINTITGATINPEFVTDNAGAFFVLADSGQLFICWLDAWHDYIMEMMDMDNLEVVADGQT